MSGPRRRGVCGALAAAILGSGLAFGPAPALGGAIAHAEPSPATGVALTGADVVRRRAADGGLTGLHLTVWGTPGASVRARLAGVPPLALPEVGPGVYQAELALQTWLTPRRAADAARRFVVELTRQGQTASVLLEDAADATSRVSAPGTGPRIRHVALAPGSHAGQRLVVDGTPGGQGLAWVPDSDGAVQVRVLDERAPGRYEADLPRGRPPVAVELAAGGLVVTRTLDEPARLKLATRGDGLSR